jgi:hypothetical protein
MQSAPTCYPCRSLSTSPSLFFRISSTLSLPYFVLSSFFPTELSFYTYIFHQMASFDQAKPKTNLSHHNRHPLHTLLCNTMTFTL